MWRLKIKFPQIPPVGVYSLYVFTYFGVLYFGSVVLRFLMHLFRSFRSRVTQAAPFKWRCFCLKPELVDVFRKLSTNMALPLSSS